MSDSISAPDPEALKKLIQLRLSGEISEEQFAEANGQGFAGSDTEDYAPRAAGSARRTTRGADAQAVDSGNKLACLLHVSQLSAYLLPIVGLVAPVIIWFVFRVKHPELSMHLRQYFNWFVSFIIFAVILGILAVTPVAPLAVVGIFALVVAGVAFPIIAGVKAYGGEVWPYPLAFQIF